MAEAASSEKILVELKRQDADVWLRSRVSGYETKAEREIGLSICDALLAPDSTQQQFDLSSFRKEVEERQRREREAFLQAERRGCDEDEAFHDGRLATFTEVLALLPAEEETT